MNFRTAYDGVIHPGYDCVGESKTLQTFKKDCDINFILKKYKKTGLLDHVSRFQGQYADLSEPVDYLTAMQIVINADAMFNSLPADIRKKFDNDPAVFMEFADNPDNQEEMIELGLLPKPVPESVQQSVVEPVPEPQPEPEA